MLKGRHGNSLSVNLALPVLKGIKVVSGMIGKNKSQNQNQTKPNQTISVLEMHSRKNIWQQCLEPFLKHVSYIHMRAEKRDHVCSFRKEVEPEKRREGRKLVKG